LSVNFHAPNPAIDFSTSPFRVNTELRAWEKNGAAGAARRAGVSAFGFGGTNFHVVLEEHIQFLISALGPDEERLGLGSA